MKLLFTNKPSKNSVYICPVAEKEKVKNAGLARLLKKLSASKEFEAKEGRLFFAYGMLKNMPDKVLLLGLGKMKKPAAASVMSAFGGAVKFASGHHPKKLAVKIPASLASFAELIGEAICLANYQPGAPYKTGKSSKKLSGQRISDVEIIIEGKNASVKSRVEKGFFVAGVTNEVRDWVNAPPNFSNAQFFDAKAAEIAKSSGAHLTILRKKELEKLHMGALLGVNRGSPDEARLTILDYSPKDAPAKEAPVVLVGKGILFDSGGYNLKPSGHLEDMQLDKAGAAVVLAVIKLLPKLGIKRRVIAVAPFTENLIGSNAQKPSEIVTTYSGKTVEVTNTDAEGRLVLADAVAYAVDKFKPKFLVDLATLTGACVVALGTRYAGLLGNDKELMKHLRRAGNEVDELLWPLPIHKDYAEKMKGHYADLCNSSTDGDRGAGASKGAAFIREFVGKTKWAHLDIAGPAFVGDPKKYEHKGATGFGVRVLARFLEKMGN